MPARLRLILVSRSEPALPLARWRAAGLIAELRMAELRFDLSESTALLTGAAGRPLSEGNVRALAERTEGWAAGLHLAGLALRAAGGESHELIGQVAGSHPYIRDYLVDEILRREPPEVQMFLLRTSILEQMCGELCDALLDDGPSSIVLEELEQRGLFVTALDGERRWFRYHTLFAEALRAVLGRVHPGLVAELHRRAFYWLEANGGIERLGEAVGHGLAAGLDEAAADLLERRTDELIWMRGEIQTLRRLTGRLPSEVVLARPKLALMECWTLLVSIQLDALDTRLRQLAAAHGPAVAGEIAGIRSFVVRITGNCQGAIELGRLALELISPQRTIVQHVIRMSLESTYFMVGDLNAAEQIAADLREHLGNGPIPPFLLIAGVGLSKADLLMRRARPCEAEQFLRAALTEAERRSGGVLTSTGMIFAMLSEARYAQGELGDAEQLARAAMAEGERWYNTDMRLNAQDHLGRALRALGDIAGAEALAATSRDLVRSYRVPYINSWARIGEATDAFLRGDPGPAEQALADHGVHADGPLDPAEFDAYVLLARVNLVRGHIDDAAGLVGRLRALAEQGSYTMRVILADMLRAQIEQAAGRKQEACSILERVLGAAMPGGLVQCFVDEGEPMRRLLEQWIASSLAHPSTDPEQRAVQKRLQVYGMRLLRQFPQTEFAVAGEAPDRQGRDKETRSRRRYLPFGGEQLTVRELEVLRLVAIGRSNQAIAQLLTISLHTVKKHMTSVLEKLGAESRTAAVVRARELGIV
jgi:LuxR family maltose regulon positive regulatory protein